MKITDIAKNVEPKAALNMGEKIVEPAKQAARMDELLRLAAMLAFHDSSTISIAELREHIDRRQNEILGEGK